MDDYLKNINDQLIKLNELISSIIVEVNDRKYIAINSGLVISTTTDITAEDTVVQDRPFKEMAQKEEEEKKAKKEEEKVMTSETAGVSKQ